MSRAFAFAAALLLISTPVGPSWADDGPDGSKPGPSASRNAPEKTAKNGAEVPKPGAAPGPELFKGVLGDASEMVQELAKKAAKKERENGFPSPETFNSRFTHEMEAAVLRSIAQAQARLGDLPAARSSWQSALDTISSMTSPENRLPLLLQIAEDQIDAGETADAGFTLRLANQMIRTIRPEAAPDADKPRSPFHFGGGVSLAQKAEFLGRAARIEARLGKAEQAKTSLEEAVKTADGITDRSSRFETLVKLAREADPKAAEDIWRKAWKLGLEEKNDYNRGRNIEHWLRARVEKGQLDVALKTIDGELKGEHRNFGLWTVADALASGEMGAGPGPLERLNQLAMDANFQRNSRKIKVFRRLAEAQARLGRYEDAYRTIGEPFPVNNVQTFFAMKGRMQVMRAVAEAQLKEKRPDAARNTVQAALEAIPDMPDDDAQAYFPVTELGGLLARAGDFRGAFGVAATLSASKSKLDVLNQIAVAQYQEGKRDEARKTIGQALDVFKNVPKELLWQFQGTTSIGGERLDPSMSILADIAKSQARIGEIDAASKALSRFGTSSFAQFQLIGSIKEIVEALVKADELDGANRIAALVPKDASLYSDDKAQLLEKIARRQAERHDPKAVLKWAEKADAPRAKLQMLRGLADGIAERAKPKADAKAKPKDAQTAAGPLKGQGEARP